MCGHITPQHACTNAGLERQFGTSWHVRYSGYRILRPWNSVLGGLEWDLFSDHRSHRRVRREHYSVGPHTVHTSLFTYFPITLSKQQVNRLAISPEYSLVSQHTFIHHWYVTPVNVSWPLRYTRKSTFMKLPVLRPILYICPSVTLPYIRWLRPLSSSPLKDTLWMWLLYHSTARENGWLQEVKTGPSKYGIFGVLAESWPAFRLPLKYSFCGRSSHLHRTYDNSAPGISSSIHALDHSLSSVIIFSQRRLRSPKPRWTHLVRPSR